MSKRTLIMNSLLILALGSACGGDPTDPGVDNTVASVTVTGLNKVQPGSTVQLVAKAKNAAGTEITAPSITWSSSAQAIASVNANGLVSGINFGTAEITATISGVAGKMNVSVETIAPASNASVQVAPGGYFEFSPSQVDVNAGGEVAWMFTLDSYGYATHNVTFTAVAGAPENIGNTPNGTVTRTFSTPGTYNYHCTNHPGQMIGKVVVH